VKIIPSETWSRLTQGQVEGQVLWTRIASPEVSDKLLAAIDATGARHLLIHLGEDSDQLQDSESRGLSVSTRDLLAPGAKPGRYLDLVCSDPNSYGIFDIIGGELVQGLESADNPISLVKGTLTKWRRFWAQTPLRILSVEEQIGLFAELWFLINWLIPYVGASQAISRWRGPFGSRHDFEWSGTSVEIKGTRSTRGSIHWIHGLEQLSPPEKGELFLFSLQVREEQGAESSLDRLVASLEAQVTSDDEAWAKFESALAQSGYVKTYEDEYSKLRLRVVTEGLFIVDDNFPRITPERIVGGTPPGVEQVNYEINLSGFQELRIAQHFSEQPVAALFS
jgi:hypothetical protein